MLLLLLLLLLLLKVQSVFTLTKITQCSFY
jgi:hypothetical protein